MTLESELKGLFRNDYHRGLINLLFTSNRIMEGIHCIIKNHGLTPQQYNILRILGKFREEEINLNFIKCRMIDKHSDVSRVVENLYRKKLVIRVENKTDRRQKSIRISSKGLRLLEEMDEIRGLEDTLLESLNKEEITELNRLLDKIRSGVRPLSV